MTKSRKAKLIEIDWPEFGGGEPVPRTLSREFENRIAATRRVMKKRGLTHLVVYADREHFANMAYLTGFDPRFEEALLVLREKETPLLIVGNECVGRLPVSPLHNKDKLRHERFQPFSLLNQPRNQSRLLKQIFRDEKVGRNSSVGCAGWKYFSESEHPSGACAIEIPAYIVDTLRDLASPKGVVNATDIFMHPGYGLRTFCSASEIAYFEFTNVLASEGVKRMIFGLRDGMLDYDVAKLAEYCGEPLGCHMSMKTAANRTWGLSGPMGGRVRRGGVFSTGLCYWGSNICRAGWVAKSAGDLPEEAREYVAEFAGPYFEVMAEWFELLKIGTPGHVLADIISKKLPFDKFNIFLNPGHLIHLDEWLSSPIFHGSKIKLHSGMVMQVDVIPSSKKYYSTRMEDGLATADRKLRDEIKNRFPECYRRCRKRREFMRTVLGIRLSEEILPLSNMPAIVPPFLLKPNAVFTVR
jgi:hypothetical protein